MSLRINIEISLAENEHPNAREQAILDSMAAHPSNGAAQEAAIAKVVEKVTAGVAAKTEAPKAAAPKAPVGRPKAAPKAAEVPMVLDTTLDEEVPDDQDIAEADAEETEDDLVGGEETTDYSKTDAIAAATKLVSTQKQAVVKAALGVVGAKRVSDLNEHADIQAFMAALEG